MIEQDKNPPAGLHPSLVTKLLDHLESNDTFRAQFQQSPEQALRSLGYTGSLSCLQLKQGVALASPEQIKAQRSKLQDTLVSVQSQLCPFDAQESF